MKVEKLHKAVIDYYSNSYHHPIGKKAINADYSALIEKNESHLNIVKWNII